jgi:nitrite reductase/ring-hydroxylating ferredoxin subunit
MERWVRVAATTACPPGAALECVVEDRVVALFNVAGQFHALEGLCPHQGGPLGKGLLKDHFVTCPWHGWQFDVCTGRHKVPAGPCHTRFETRVDAEGVWVLLQDTP